MTGERAALGPGGGAGGAARRAGAPPLRLIASYCVHAPSRNKVQ